MNSSSEEVDLHEENMYVVEKILRRQYRRRDGRREPHYLIRWQGFPKQEDFTWEPLSNLASVNFMVEQFQAKLIERKKKESLIQLEQKDMNGDKKELKTPMEKFLSRPIDFQHQEEDKLRKKIKPDQSQKQKMKIPNSRHVQPSKMDTFIDPIILKHPQLDKKVEIPRREQKDQKQSKQLKQQKNQKQQKILNQINQKVIYGRIVNHLYQNGRMVYEVQRLNNEKKVLKIMSISSDKAQTLCLKAVFEYLQSFLIDLQSLNKSQ